MYTKSIFASRTFWFTLLKAIAGAVVVFSTAYPNVGILVMLSSLVEFYLRATTTQPVSL